MTEKDKNDIADIVMRKMLAARQSMSEGLDNLNDVLFTLINADLKTKVDKINDKLDQIENEKRKNGNI